MTTNEFQSVKGALRPLLGTESVQKEAVLDVFFTEDHSQKVLLFLPIPDMHHSIVIQMILDKASLRCIFNVRCIQSEQEWSQNNGTQVLLMTVPDIT